MAIPFSVFVNLFILNMPRERVAGDAVTSAALLITFIRESWVSLLHWDKSRLVLSPTKPPKSVNEVQFQNMPRISFTFEESICGTVVNEVQL